jgi:hypothetical protein
MYTVKMNDGTPREVERREGLELVAGKKARWHPPLARQLLREGDAVKERVEVGGGGVVTRVVPSTAADAASPRRKLGS